MNTNSLPVSTESSTSQDIAQFMSKVYLWMTFGIALSAAVAFAIANNEEVALKIVLNKPVFYGLFFLQLGAVITLSAAIRKINALTATAIYLAYAALSGVTLSTIFLVFTRDSIVHVFVLTAFSFAGLSGVGYVTKKDLGPVGSFCTMGLFGMVGFGLLSIFFPSLMTDTASKVYGIVGVIVFAGLTAYDTQKIKTLSAIDDDGTGENQKAAVHGALILYLDFINLFLSLLRLTGKRR